MSVKVLEVYLEDLRRVIGRGLRALAQEEYAEDCVSSELRLSRLNQTYSWCGNWNWSTKLHCLHRANLVSNSPTLSYFIPLLKNLWSVLSWIWTEEFHLTVFHFISSFSSCVYGCMIACSSLLCIMIACILILWWLSFLCVSISSLWSSSNSSEFDKFLKISHSPHLWN